MRVERNIMMNVNDATAWERMSVDEYAALQSALGAKLVHAGNMWWRSVRPFFYRPLVPYRPTRSDSSYPHLSAVGGVQHVVPDGEQANSHLNLLLFESPHTYSVESLSPRSRKHVRRAMRTFTAKPINDADEFIAQAYPVYLSFYERTRYSYKKERTKQEHFAAWARTLFRFRKVRVFGAYRGAVLASVIVSHLVEDVVFIPTFFSSTDALGEYVSDVLLHTIREEAAMSKSVSLIFAASAGMERGIDDYYLLRGAKLVSKPALLRMNPLLMHVLKRFRNGDYLKLGIGA